MRSPKPGEPLWPQPEIQALRAAKCRAQLSPQPRHESVSPTPLEPCEETTNKSANGCPSQKGFRRRGRDRVGRCPRLLEKICSIGVARLRDHRRLLLFAECLRD